MNSSFDYSSVKYASSKSRMTVKTKKKLDEIAAQVELWNKDSFIRKRRIISKEKKMDVASIRSKFITNDENKPLNALSLQKTPPNSKELSDKLMLTNLSSVKKNAAFFEKLSSQQETLLNNKATPQMKVKRIIPFTPLNVSYEQSDIANKENRQMNSYIKNPFKFVNSEQSNVNVEKSKPFKNVLTENNQIVTNINKSDEIICVKTPEEIKQTNSLVEETVSLVEESETECSLPPPPAYSSDGYTSDEVTYSASLHSSSSTDTISSDDVDTVDDVTDVSSLAGNKPADKSISMLEDIYEELRKQNYLSESDSVDMLVQYPTKEVTPKKIRRSLSWNEKISYIEPESEGITTVDESTEESLKAESDDVSSIDDLSKIDSDDNVRETFDCSTSFRDAEPSLSYVDYESESPIDSVVTALADTTALMAKIVKDQKDAADALNDLLMSERMRPGSEEHINLSLRVIENSLRRISLAEKDNLAKGALEAQLDINNIQLCLRDDFVLIDCGALRRDGRARDLGRLRVLHNIVVMIRCRSDHQLQRSQVYSIVPRTEARRLSLPFDGAQRLSVFEYVRFSKLWPEFQFHLEIYCMSVCPSKDRKAAKNDFTPIKKLLGLSTPSSSNVPMSSSSSSMFTNVGSLLVTAKGLGSRNQMTGARLDMTAGVPLTGEVSYSADFELSLMERRSGKLNVYSDVAGVGSWAYYECRLHRSGLFGWRISEQYDPGYNGPPDFELPFKMCIDRAEMAKYSVCAKPNTISVTLAQNARIACSSTTPINRRVSSDGQRKYRFLAEAPSYDDAVDWCDSFNRVRDSFYRWAHTINDV